MSGFRLKLRKMVLPLIWTHNKGVIREGLLDRQSDFVSVPKKISEKISKNNLILCLFRKIREKISTNNLIFFCVCFKKSVRK